MMHAMCSHVCMARICSHMQSNERRRRQPRHVSLLPPSPQPAAKKPEEGRKLCVIQTAPAVRVAIAETLGLPPGAIKTGQLVTGLKMLGFDRVFDTLFGAGE
jgi:iron only hydrogenase large subunit-like protein